MEIIILDGNAANMEKNMQMPMSHEKTSFGGETEVLPTTQRRLYLVIRDAWFFENRRLCLLATAQGVHSNRNDFEKMKMCLLSFSNTETH